MKKATFLLVVLALLFSTPALAREHEPTGDRIWILDSGAQDYPANTPFYIMHGWGDVAPGTPAAQVRFELEVDGVVAKPTYVERSLEHGPDGPAFYTSWVFNFAEGMTGQHTFEGHWIVPCYIALYYGYVTECANPMADYDWVYSEVVVTFDPAP